MAQTDLSNYKNLYLQTAKEYVDKISVSLDQLSSDVFNKEALNNLHISSHSLKSQSQVMGYDDIVQLSKTLEEISNNALAGNIKLNNDILININKSAENIKKILKQVQNDNK